MLYFFPLKWVAVVVGLLYVAGHLPGIISPKSYSIFLKTLPRNAILGHIAMGLAIAWFCFITAKVDLGEIAGWRSTLVGIWLAGGGALIFYVPTFLLGRGLGCLLMLGASLLLESAFLEETSWRYLITGLAYVWVVGGLALVYSPYLFRDLILFAAKTPQQCRCLCIPGTIYGCLLVAVALAYYS